jgi:uncharacterized protein
MAFSSRCKLCGKVRYTLEMTNMNDFISDQPRLDEKFQKVIRDLKSYHRVAIAFSGGVDSALLLKLTMDSLGENCIALIGTSPIFSPQEKWNAVETAKLIGAPFELIETSEMQDPAYIENSSDRCYHCRLHFMNDLFQRAKTLGFHYLIDGVNADDLSDYRPGIMAAKQLGVRSPFMDADITKEEIRQLAHLLDLPVWNKPASACLASRIPYGTTITIEVLNQINNAEIELSILGFTSIRVRHYRDLARIELIPEEFDWAITLRQEIIKSLKDIGYTYITLDLDGFRSGSMNLVLDTPEKI